MLNKYPKVFAIVLNYNNVATIKACLDSLYRQNYQNFEIIVVDNASKDGSFELAKRLYSKAYFISNSHNLGFAAGNNPAIRYALEKMADFIFLLNSDAEVKADTIEKLVEAASENKKAGMFSPVIYDPANEIWFSGGRISYLQMKTLHQTDMFFQNPYSTDYVTGCAMLIKKEVFGKIGLLDEEFFLYYEDAEFCLRARRSGFLCVVVPGAKVMHREKSEENENGENKLYWLVISGIIFFRKKTSLFPRTWALIYLVLRRLKNELDMSFWPNPQAKIVNRAYRDYFSQKNGN
jgi:GT2 family glycosyltransferase